MNESIRYSARLMMNSREQQTPKGLHEKTVTLRANRIRKSLDYTKLENPLYVGQRHEPRQNASEDHIHTGEKDESLVKHMRNLPGYLQREEKGEKNIQGKALNFGVLDWGRLENWKSNEKRIPPRYNMKKTSSPSHNHNRKKMNPHRRDQQRSNTTPNSSSSERLPPGVRWPRGQVLKLQIPETSGQMLDDMQTQSVELDTKKGKQSETKIPSKDIDINHGDDVLISPDVHMIEANESRASDSFSPEVEFDSVIPFSDVPHSCPFPLSLDSVAEPEVDLPLTPSTDEQSGAKGRHSSPMRRFSFSSLGKMTRSFSFKESSSIPQLSPTYISVKSGPVNLESEDHRWKKGNATTPSRSSPLRRLLDPLLKLKGGAHFSDKVQKPKMDLNDNESIHSKKQYNRSSNVQALLQLTMKNGIPFFKLVIESSSDILAAAVKKLPSGKDDSSLIYAFYSVHENKKKSGSWMMYQGSKEKNYRFGYTIVGQMKISSSYHAEFSGAEKDLYVVRESVLYSTDSVQADQKMLDCMVDRELAGIIVKNLSDESGGDIGRSNSTVVVLPDGVHSLPNFGLPSPLISRWRSGGACDCGGWDIGCQFRVLGPHLNEIGKPPSPCSSNSSNRVDLSYQGGRKKQCGFSLVSLEDGLYSVEYDQSMSLLQAFSVCVAVVSSHKLTHIFQVNSVPELSRMLTGIDDKVEVVAGKYASKPPPSPVGRV
ncbi:unnamed protein product [Lactuca saligna]|uniref:Uncharacterized protein n=1 Tax=Lactuca saligna TaxID=75948 RepID=A0AA35ZRT3_LACSI|nr:unnamed protein product [Lactuca saligna]